MTQRKIYGIITGGAIIGMIAAFLQTMEKITLLSNKDAVLTCDLNSIFSCSTVLAAWQSSVFGFPNSLMCMALFVIFGSVALVGVSGGSLPRRLRLGIQALSLFTLGFALWFFFQSIYVINALCILCIFCLIGLLVVNWGWLRINATELPIGARSREIVVRAVRTGTDMLLWSILAALVAFAMILQFA